jgi:hypothetical protein
MPCSSRCACHQYGLVGADRGQPAPRRRDDRRRKAHDPSDEVADLAIEIALLNAVSQAYARARAEVFDPAGGGLHATPLTTRQRETLIQLEAAEGELVRFRSQRRTET